MHTGLTRRGDSVIVSQVASQLTATQFAIIIIAKPTFSPRSANDRITHNTRPTNDENPEKTECIISRVMIVAG